MVGRQNKNLFLRLWKQINQISYSCTKKRSTGVSRIDRIGAITAPVPMHG